MHPLVREAIAWFVGLCHVVGLTASQRLHSVSPTSALYPLGQRVHTPFLRAEPRAQPQLRCLVVPLMRTKDGLDCVITHAHSDRLVEKLKVLADDVAAEASFREPSQGSLE